MSAPRRLGDLAHCRFGDKGDTALFVLAPYDPADYPALLRAATPARVAAQLGLRAPSQVRCMPCDALGALVVAVPGSLGGGVTASLALDAHGKTRSGILLALPLEE